MKKYLSLLLMVIMLIALNGCSKSVVIIEDDLNSDTKKSGLFNSQSVSSKESELSRLNISDEENINVYDEYKRIINEYEIEYGVSELCEMSSNFYFKGVSLVMLYDLNSDGNDELIIVYSPSYLGIHELCNYYMVENSIDVYGLDRNNDVKLWNSQRIMSYGNSGQTFGLEITEIDGKKFIGAGHESYDWQYMECTLNNSQITYDFKIGMDITSDGPISIFYINDQEVSSEYFKEQRNLIENNSKKMILSCVTLSETKEVKRIFEDTITKINDLASQKN